MQNEARRAQEGVACALPLVGASRMASFGFLLARSCALLPLKKHTKDLDAVTSIFQSVPDRPCRQ
jgi:hypothetical protein